MRRLSSLAWRSLVSRRLRGLLTTAGIALGVGVLFAALAVNSAIDTSVDRTVAQLLGNASLRVSTFQETGLGAATREAIANTPGVAVAAPEVERRTYLAPKAGAGPDLLPPVTVLGVDPKLDPQIHPQALVAGEPLSPTSTLVAWSRGALISQALADQEGLRIGSTLTLLGPGDPADSTFAVTGILPANGPLPTSGDRVVVVPLGAAMAVFELTGVTRVDIMLAPGAREDGVTAALEQNLRSEPYLLSGPADLAAGLRASTTDFQATTALIAAVSLFVGAFLIFNTLSMTVAERVREVALLRAAGATRRQVYWLVLLQALALGVLGSVVGVFLGLGLAVSLGSLIAGQVAAVGSLPVGTPQATVPAVLIALGVGLVVTLAAAIEPAWRAGHISPVEALKQRPELSRALAARLRWLLAVFLVIGVTALLVWPRNAGRPGLLGSVLVYGLLLVVTLLSPFLLPVLGRIAGLPFGLFLRTEERLARSELVREKSRTALTVGSLSIGLAMIVAIAAVGQNDRRAATAWLAEVVPGDEIATSIRPTALGEGVQDELAGVAGVERVSPIAHFDLAYNGVRVDGAAVVGSDLLADGRLTFVTGNRQTALPALDVTGAAILPKPQADRLGLKTGDDMTFTTEQGRTTKLRIAGVIDRSLPGRAGEAILVGWPDATEFFGVQGADAFAIRLTPGAAVSTARAAVESKARELALVPNPVEAVQGAVGDTLDRVFGLFDALAAIAVVVAGLGIVNTLTMSVVERVREIGVLRAVGMTRRQIWRMVVLEAGLVGVMGAAMGCVTGLLVAGLMIGLANGAAALPSIEIPWAVVGLAAVFGVVVSMLAAAYPARLASRMSIVRAVQFE